MKNYPGSKICTLSTALLITELGLAANPSSMATPPAPVAPICYLKEFQEKGFPWKAGDCLNYEEVFKDYEYFESKWNDQTLTIKKYVQGNVVETHIYGATSDRDGKWQLQKK